MSTKINIDALVTALSSEKVAEQLAKLLQPLIQLSLDEILNKQLSVLNTNVESLRKELKDRNEQISVLAKENSDLKQVISHQSQQIEHLESYNRQDNLIIHGVPVSSYAQATNAHTEAQFEHSSETEHLFLNLCAKLELDIQPGDISICHRLPKHSSHQHAPIIVRFSSRKARSAVLNARKKLRNDDQKIYINEHLTHQAAKLFASSRRLLKDHKVAQVWTRNGQVSVKLLNGTVKVVNGDSDIQSLL